MTRGRLDPPPSWGEAEISHARFLEDFVARSARELRKARLLRSKTSPSVLSLRLSPDAGELVRRVFPSEVTGASTLTLFVDGMRVHARSARTGLFDEDHVLMRCGLDFRQAWLSPEQLPLGRGEVYSQLRQDGASQTRALEIARVV